MHKADGNARGSGSEWHSCRSGVRALPPRSPAGALPLVGLVPPRLLRGRAREPEPQAGSPCGQGRSDAAEPSDVTVPALPPVWLIVGLGSRGLVYHAWAAKQLATAIVRSYAQTDAREWEGIEQACIPMELRAWQRQPLQGASPVMSS
jgi:hypothetical protein